MGLLDILNGMQNGPRGGKDSGGKESGGMSPVTMAILALLAYKAYQKMSGGTATASPGQAPRIPQQPQDAGSAGGGLGDLLRGGLGDLLGGGAPQRGPRGGMANAGPGGGGLEDLLKGGLGGILAGGAAGSVLGGGLEDLLKQLQRNGQGEAADSWVGRGPNKDISSSDLARSLGIDDIDAMTRASGLSRDELLSGLSHELPDFVDRATPDGRLPTEDEYSRWV